MHMQLCVCVCACVHVRVCVYAYATRAAGDIASGGSASCTLQIKCGGSFTTAPSIILSWSNERSSSSSSSSSVSLRLLLPCTPLMLLEPRSISQTQYFTPPLPLLYKRIVIAAARRYHWFVVFVMFIAAASSTTCLPHRRCLQQQRVDSGYSHTVVMRR